MELCVVLAICAGGSVAHASDAEDGREEMLQDELQQEINGFLEVASPDLDPRNDGWGAFVAVYGWLAGVKGTVVEGESTEIDVPFEDFLSATDTGFQMYVEIRWRKWFIGFDGTWATLAFGVETRIVDVDIRIDQKLFDLRLGYRVWDEILEEKSKDNPWGRLFIVDAFVGVRYFLTEITVTTTPIVGAPSVIAGEDERFDPFLGARLGWQIELPQKLRVNIAPCSANRSMFGVRLIAPSRP